MAADENLTLGGGRGWEVGPLTSFCLGLFICSSKDGMYTLIPHGGWECLVGLVYAVTGVMGRLHFMSKKCFEGF